MERYLPLWARVLTPLLRVQTIWPDWLAHRWAREWVDAYMAWKRDGYPE